MGFKFEKSLDASQVGDCPKVVIGWGKSELYNDIKCTCAHPTLSSRIDILVQTLEVPTTVDFLSFLLLFTLLLAFNSCCPEGLS